MLPALKSAIGYWLLAISKSHIGKKAKSQKLIAKS
jgi:hypothetical protein